MEGLFQKYLIHKADGSDVDPSADYFVLRIDKDEHARKALLAYAIYVKDENRKLHDDILEKLEGYKAKQHTVQTYSIWREGYAATGERGEAGYFGQAEGRSFKEACDNLAETDEYFRSYYNPEQLTWWGCSLYDNEMQARASFG